MRPKVFLAVVLPVVALAAGAHQLFSPRTSTRVTDGPDRVSAAVERPAPPRFAPAQGADDGAGPGALAPALDDVAIEKRTGDLRRQGPPHPELTTQVVPALTAALEAHLRENSGSLDSLDCRGAGCMADLTWATAELAMSQQEALLALASRFNCQSRFGLRSAPGQSGRAVLFFDSCEPMVAQRGDR